MNKYDRKHLANVRFYQREIDRIFKIAAEESAAIADGLEAPEDGLFSFDDYPRAQKEMEALQRQMASRLTLSVADGVSEEWALSNAKNDALADEVLKEEERLARYYRTNTEARDAFLNRKESGLTLSDRVWRYTEQFKEEIEMGIDCGLREGLDAPAMARQLKQFLQHPDKLFRRVRDQHGNLKLSKAAAAYHPGQGVYRSSYKNARRLAATETNMAYRTADHERWQQLDFIVGIEIHLSNNHTCLGRDGKPHPFHDICDELKGKYPKDFKFTGWHPHCRCIATTIMKTDAELEADDEAILRGDEPSDPNASENAVTELPDNFTQWVEDNQERIDRAKSLPYFLRDNEKLINWGGLSAEQQRAIDALSYKDNSRYVIDKLSAPYDKIIESDYRAAITFDDYTSGSDEINDVARFGKLRTKSYNSNDVDEWKDYIRTLDDVIEKMPRLSQDVDLFRASNTLGGLRITGMSINEINSLIGETFVDKGFTSFSFSRKFVEKSFDTDYVIVLKAKKGLKGASLANTSSYNVLERQEEFLVARKTGYKIMGAKEIKGQKYLFVEVDNASTHKYGDL